MVAVLVDVHLAEATTESRGMNVLQINSTMAGRYALIFKKHELTYDEFKTSYDYYLEHPDLLNEVYIEVTNQLTTMESKVKSKMKIKPLPVQLPDSVKTPSAAR